MTRKEKLRVLIVHNAYQLRGGEDSVVDAERELLGSRGHEVQLYSRHNDELAAMSTLDAARQTLWSKDTLATIDEQIVRFQPDIMHAHNTFPLVSPSLYWAAHRAGIPVVQTLHNFRLLCPQAMFLRDGKVCEDCLGKLPWRGVTRACYRGSRAQSAVLGGMIVLHRGLGTYRSKVARYIALNEFCRTKFIEGGLPRELIAIKPNFVDFPAPEAQERSGFLFVGRLSPEKGTDLLARVAELLPDISIRVAGVGPLESRLENIHRIRLLGSLTADEVRREMCRAQALIMPSIWYENFPRTLVEAFACGLPVIASRLGAMAELVEEGKTGLLFDPGSAGDLAEKIAWAEANPAAMREMGKQARRVYEAKYTPQMNYTQLMDIYCDAIASKVRQLAPETA